MDVNQAFKHACKFILGEEIGEMHEYEDYLKEALIGDMQKSAFSNNELFVMSDQYCKNARFFDYGKEQDKLAQILSKPFNINEVKDIDSLIQSTKEKFVYAGAKVLGKSSEVTESDNIIDSSYIYKSSMLYNCKYMAYCHLIRNGEYCFATVASGDGSWAFRCFYNNSLQRCFECAASVPLRDAYFCYCLQNCNDCMFTFNQKAKSFMIGNIQLEKQTYLELKKKLLSEVVDMLKTKKRLDFSIVEISKLEEVNP